ncbi:MULTISPECIES: hypothetical protein [Cysteiniphilum]|uniref:PAS domain-containing protein n=1 Tax=Cysteiniphilum litorale TaxID=2056700 RepID=A0A8J2Z548_9GAMM|nr:MULTISPECIES: hypothetical protein [Cysteiniphilum]WHN66311.1 hypothetical protein NYP54_03515 [Cysteiniphilum sp. QT6929]GGF99811.1 hypothetical protein GCM10010995_16370 [Cysteiniphilum litorale]
MHGNKLKQIITSYVEMVDKESGVARFAKDLNGRVIACNQSYYQLAGYSSAAQLIGKTAAEVSAWQNLYAFCILGEHIVLKSGTKYLNLERFPGPFGESDLVVTEKEPVIVDGRICGLVGRSKPLNLELKVDIRKDKYLREVVIVDNRYFHTINLPIKLFKVLIYATWWQLDYKAIAQLLFCSESTVKKHFGALYDYFQLYDKQRNLYELKKIANLFLTQEIVDLCFGVYKKSNLRRPNSLSNLAFKYACL